MPGEVSLQLYFSKFSRGQVRSTKRSVSCIFIFIQLFSFSTSLTAPLLPIVIISAQSELDNGYFHRSVKTEEPFLKRLSIVVHVPGCSAETGFNILVE